MPILLLPPSTTSQSVEDEILSSFKYGEVESFSALRKRKRYGAGLGNLGNTCFMNATLQCLAHTWPLRQYFLSGQFRDDLNRENPLGTGGELAIEFAKLLQEMWGLSSNCDSDRRSTLSSYSYNYKWMSPQTVSSTHAAVVYPSSFKYALGKHAEQFMGYDQHDSQELATFLLDALHEDTNRVTKKPYIEKPEQGEMETDDEAAAKSWALHLKRENSRVLENFMGQVKSRVECPRPGCGRVSTTFDPFMYLSVPIPGASDRTISFVYVPLNPSSTAKNLHVVISKTADILQLRQAIAAMLNTLAFEDPVHVDDLVVREVYLNEVYTFYSDNTEISTIRDGDKIFVFRIIPMLMLSDESPATLPEPPHLPLDEAEITELTTDDKWRSTLLTYVKQPLQLAHLFNARSHVDERLDFLESARNLLERCFSCPECVAYRLNWERKVNHDTTSQVGEGHHDSSSDSLKPSVDEADIGNATSIEERCCNARIFKNIRSAVDVAKLEFCSRKFYQLCKEVQFPGEIQIVFSKYDPYASYRIEGAFGFPLVLRISSSLTVYELRKVLADRLSAYLHHVGHDDGMSNRVMQDDDLVSLKEDTSASLSPLDIMRQVHLQYMRHNANYRNTAYRTLGASFNADEKYMSTTQRLASPEDEDEQKSVLDIVGNHGKVVVPFPDHIYRENLNDRLMFKVESGRTIQGTDADDNRTTVLQCIRKYCQKEQLEETDMWYCDRCREHVPAWKQIGLYRLPPILIVHLKRFQFSATSHRRSKIETPIDFPLVGLDLRDEAKHWLEGEEPIYDCYALTNHFGGLGGGHYTAFAQNDEAEWCGFDDSRVTTGLSNDSIITPAAYVLYYKRRDVILPVESILIENPPLVMDVDEDRLSSSNEISMGKSSPSVDILQPDASSLENPPADDRDDSISDTL
jgi:ubiquitin C-terminal hydrolase